MAALNPTNLPDFVISNTEISGEVSELVASKRLIKIGPKLYVPATTSRAGELGQCHQIGRCAKSLADRSSLGPRSDHRGSNRFGKPSGDRWVHLRGQRAPDQLSASRPYYPPTPRGGTNPWRRYTVRRRIISELSRSSPISRISFRRAPGYRYVAPLHFRKSNRG